MWLKTPRAKVFWYRAIVRTLCGAAILFGALGILRFINPFFGVGVVAVSLVTLFASSQSDFAKEVRSIIEFSGCGDPETLRLQLESDGKMVIECGDVFMRYLLKRNPADLQGRKAARVNYKNAKEDFRRRWRMCARMDALPLRDADEPWESANAFLKNLRQKKKESKTPETRIYA